MGLNVLITNQINILTIIGKLDDFNNVLPLMKVTLNFTCKHLFCIKINRTEYRMTTKILQANQLTNRK